jgi:hypothetical protein
MDNFILIHRFGEEVYRLALVTLLKRHYNITVPIEAVLGQMLLSF